MVKLADRKRSKNKNMERKEKNIIKQMMLEEIRDLIPKIFSTIEKYKDDKQKMQKAIIQVFKNRIIDVEAENLYGNKESLKYEHKKKKIEI